MQRKRGHRKERRKEDIIELNTKELFILLLRRTYELEQMLELEQHRNAKETITGSHKFRTECRKLKSEGGLLKIWGIDM